MSSTRIRRPVNALGGNTSWFVLLARLFCAAIVCVFASLPLALCYTSVVAIFHDPYKLDLTGVAVFFCSAAVAYFLLLIAFRAATGRGRRSDGGLLPLLVMKGFVALFALVGAAILGMGLWDRELVPVLGGAFYLVASVIAWKSIGPKPMSETRQ